MLVMQEALETFRVELLSNIKQVNQQNTVMYTLMTAERSSHRFQLLTKGGHKKSLQVQRKQK